MITAALSRMFSRRVPVSVVRNIIVFPVWSGDSIVKRRSILRGHVFRGEYIEYLALDEEINLANELLLIKSYSK